MTPAEVDAVVYRACTRKRPILGRNAAIAMAARATARAHAPVRAYRCPFADGDRHWHLGHVPSMETVEQLAEAIRTRAQAA